LIDDVHIIELNESPLTKPFFFSSLFSIDLIRIKSDGNLRADLSQRVMLLLQRVIIVCVCVCVCMCSVCVRLFVCVYVLEKKRKKERMEESKEKNQR
jgi:hypothetical protein